MKQHKLKEGEQPQGKISDKLLNEGTQMCVLAGPRSWDIENWIIDLRESTSQEIDWCFQGGRAYVLAMGDLEKVRKAIEESKPAFNKHYRATQKDAHGNERRHAFDIQWG